MPTNRVPIHRPQRRPLKPETIAAFRLLVDILDAEGWEALAGPRRDEFIATNNRLHYQLLGRRPWEWNVLHATSPSPPDWMNDRLRREDYKHAHRIFCALWDQLADQLEREAIERRVRGR